MSRLCERGALKYWLRVVLLDDRVDELRNSWGFAGKKLEFVETATESLVVQVGRCMSATTNCGYRSHHHRVVPVLC
jgi:isopenicillin N synthase-like dioxygenase